MDKRVNHSFFGEAAQLHHIGLVVRSIAEAEPGMLGVADPIQDVRVAFVVVNGVQIELLEPLGENSPIASNLNSNVKLVHLCFEVPDIRGALSHARQHGFHCIRLPAPAVAFNGREIAWVYSRTYGLVELLQGELFT